MLDKILSFLEETVSSYLLIFSSLLIFGQVISRKVFSYSPIWSEELARYCIIWFIFFGSSLAVKKGSHATVDVLVAYLPQTPKKYLEIITNIINLAFSIIIVIAGVLMVLKLKEIGNVTPSLRLPMYVPYLAIPIGCFMMSIRYIEQLIERLKKFR